MRSLIPSALGMVRIGLERVPQKRYGLLDLSRIGQQVRHNNAGLDPSRFDSECFFARALRLIVLFAPAQLERRIRCQGPAQMSPGKCV